MTKDLKRVLRLLAFLKVPASRQIPYEILLVVIFTLSELAGVLLLLPLLNYVVERKFPVSVIETFERFGIGQFSDELIFVVLIGIYVSRFFITKYVILLQLREVYKILAGLNTKLFNRILSSGQIQKIEDVMQCGIIEANNVCVGFYMPLIRLVSEVLFVLASLVSLFILMPEMSAILFSMFAASVFVLQHSNKRSLSEYGSKRIIVDGERTAFFEFVSRSSLELKSYDVEKNAKYKFASLIEEYAVLGLKQQNIKMMQKYWIETLFVVSAVLSFSISYFFISPSDTLQTAVVFGAVSIKTLPAFSRITNFNNSLHYFKSSVAKYIDFVEGLEK